MRSKPIGAWAMFVAQLLIVSVHAVAANQDEYPPDLPNLLYALYELNAFLALAMVLVVVILFRLVSIIRTQPLDWPTLTTLTIALMLLPVAYALHWL